MSSQPLPFVYEPLQAGEIRLLYPEHKTSGELRWLLKIVQIKDQDGKRTSLQYDALSYTWGSQAQTFPIICNNEQLQVHHNLMIALPYLAQRDSQLPIWIDAVCINQADPKEKMKQIRMMIDIYTGAWQVWVWFGPGNRESENVISKLPQIIETIDDDIVRHVSVSPKIMSWLSSDEAWSSFYDLVENKWYSRLWVFQETAFARRVRVMLGNHEVAWDTLRHLIKPTDWHFAGADGQEPRKISNWARNIFLTRQMTQKAKNAGTTLTVLGATRIVKATMEAFCFDPRDRLFALLGYITIEVTDDMSLESMYVQLARAVLLNLDPESSHWWSFLHLAASKNKSQDLPSWCPDFHDVAGRISSRRSILRFAASKRKTKPQVSFDLKSRELVLRGQMFDTIEIVFDEYVDDDYVETSQKLRAFHAWEESLEADVLSVLMPVQRRRLRVYDDEAAIKAAYWSTILDGFNTPTSGPMKETMSRLPYQSLEQLRKGREAALKVTEPMELLEQSPFAVQHPSRENFPEFTQHMVGIMPVVASAENSRIFVTTQGRLGRGPSSIKAGDQVCIFSYAKTAHIVRRAPATNRTSYMIVGSAYVHGMMNGEIEDLDIEEKDIVLV